MPVASGFLIVVAFFRKFKALEHAEMSIESKGNP